MTVKAQTLGHDIHYDGDNWVLSSTGEKLYTPELASGDQTLRCIRCLKYPTPEGHDGCLGTLVSDKHGGIQNACCGHGNDRLAYIQYVNKDEGGQHIDIRGEDAIEEQSRLVCKKI